MVMNMHKYDHTKGSKAFSYFSVVAKNYLILHENYQKSDEEKNDNDSVKLDEENKNTDETEDFDE